MEAVEKAGKGGGWLGSLFASIVLTLLSAIVFHVYETKRDSSPPHSSFDVSTPDGPSLSEVGGLCEIKRQLHVDVVLPLTYPRLFFDGPALLRPPRGILLYGSPGTGKTMLSKAVAHAAKVPFLCLTPSSLESKWFGETPKLLEKAFTLARTKLAPCVVFLDEIDGMGRRRSEEDQACVHSLKTELLRNLDGNGSAAAVSVIACTNLPSMLDPALLRRFPRRIEVPKPTRAERESILRVMLEGDASLAPLLAEHTSGMTGSDLRALCGHASSSRLRGVDEHVHESSDGEDLLRRLGPLTVHHFAEFLPTLSAASMKKCEEEGKACSPPSSGSGTASEERGDVCTSLAPST